MHLRLILPPLRYLLLGSETSNPSGVGLLGTEVNKHQADAANCRRVESVFSALVFKAMAVSLSIVAEKDKHESALRPYTQHAHDAQQRAKGSQMERG